MSPPKDLTISKEPLKKEPHWNSSDPDSAKKWLTHKEIKPRKSSHLHFKWQSLFSYQTGATLSTHGVLLHHHTSVSLWGEDEGLETPSKKTLAYFLRVRIKPDSRLHNFSDTRLWKQVPWACVWGTALMELFSFGIYTSRLCRKESSFAVLQCFLEKTFPSTC